MPCQGFGWSLSRVPIPKLVIHSSSGCVRCYWLQPFFCYHQLSANFICLLCLYFLDPSWLTVYRCYPLLLSRQSDHFYVRIGRYEGRFMPNWCMLRDHVIVNPQITLKSSFMQFVWRWRGNNCLIYYLKIPLCNSLADFYDISSIIESKNKNLVIGQKRSVGIGWKRGLPGRLALALDRIHIMTNFYFHESWLTLFVS